MDERSFLERIQSAPGDLALLRGYAHWLTANEDPRGEHLAAELDVRDAEAHLLHLEAHIRGIRSVRSSDSRWLDSILPLTVKAPVDGTFYAAPAPGEPPFIKLGDLCFPDTIVGIVERQKVFYKLAAADPGVVDEILVSHGASVTSGDIIVKLVRLQKPAARETHSG